MIKNWENAIVSYISGALYVPVGYGKAVHTNRVCHGFVLNEEGSVKDYVFSDGKVMRTDSQALFYLPKGSNYHVDTLVHTGCYAINFEADISGEPFSMTPRNAEPLFKLFKEAATAWKSQDPMRHLIARRAVYDILLHMGKEWQRNYISKTKQQKLSPALSYLYHSFTEKEISVSKMAELCGISEVYFRRLFEERCGCSPKDYIIALRMEYAKQLLSADQMSVGEVARLCGYAEPCHFSREFTKRTGVSPSLYKERPHETKIQAP